MPGRRKKIMFELDYRLQNDCVEVGSLMVSRILLMKDANYPWLILVPQRDDVSEVYHLDVDDQEQLIWESSFVAERLMETYGGDKMNIAALGNVVPQLHIHHVMRKQSDPAWPNPVWGAVPSKAYSRSALRYRVEQLQEAFETSTFKPAELPPA
jgi:diadenosine tetraphosphate (Ap4A) HIT family hydrolase